MGVEVDWRSKQGTHTDDNRDYCGVGLRDDAALCVVLDGSTSGANSGEFSQVIARDLIDWFMTVRSVTVEAVISRLRCIHSDLLPRFRRDSASFVIALINDEGAAQVLHVGDCLAGLHEGTWRSSGGRDRIRWLMRSMSCESPTLPGHRLETV